VSLPKVEKSIFETILARRSVRSFKKNRLDKATISSLLEAAVHAPTAIHLEPWAFVIIQDKKILHNLSKIAKPIFLADIHQHRTEFSIKELDVFNSPDFNIFYDADAVIAICGKTASPLFTADCWLAAENLMLAACAMGLGSCVIGSALPAFNLPGIRAELRIPDEYTVVAPIALGYPENEAPPSLRKPPVIISSFPHEK